MGCIHVWDKHGKLIVEDAVPGASYTAGLGIDRDDNIYVLSEQQRVWNGKPYFNPIAGTLVKVKAGQTKWLSAGSCPIPLPEDARPKRSVDIAGMWVEGAEWFYAGVGNSSELCKCWQQSRMTLDYFARSFAPETDQFSVAALDSNGDLILRIGQYGNEDDGMPPAGVPRGAPKDGGPMLASPNPRSIGGDEVALMHPSHVATMTDRYLYIGDFGNARIVSVKLGYHAEEKVALRAVPDQAGRSRQ
jgi:hypothetical protein